MIPICEESVLKYLDKIYDMSEGDYYVPIPSYEAGEVLGFDKIRSRIIEKILEKDGLIEYYGQVRDERGVRLTHKGIVEAKKYKNINKKIKYEIALSFAGEQRDYVENVANILHSKNIKVFYDNLEEEKTYLWGKELPEAFEEIYGRNARYCIMFISKEYAVKIWTNEERRNAISKAIKEKYEYILPARFDDTKIPGIRDTISYIDLTKTTPEDLSRLIFKKLGVSIEIPRESLKEKTVFKDSMPSFLLKKFHELLTKFANLWEESKINKMMTTGHRIEDEIDIISQNMKDLIAKSELEIPSKKLEPLKELAIGYDKFAHRRAYTGDREDFNRKGEELYQKTIELKERVRAKIEN